MISQVSQEFLPCYQCWPCIFSIGFMRQMSTSGADKAETQSLSCTYVSSMVTWTHITFQHLWWSDSFPLHWGEMKTAWTKTSPFMTNELGSSPDFEKLSWQAQKPILRWSCFTIDCMHSSSFISLMWLIQCLICEKRKLLENEHKQKQCLAKFSRICPCPMTLQAQIEPRGKSTALDQWQSIFRPNLIFTNVY